ncbi:MAG: DEAD/DEAH box helicase [bacterium]|nr:DEAD/DEAH box helicase [bacterium]
MAYISHRRPSIRPRPSRGSSRGPKSNKQAIHPSRYVKEANPAQTADYTAQNKFADFAIHPLLKNNIAGKGYKIPSEIQDKTIELGLSGRDVVGVANTGTGKTAAFAIPILNKLVHERDSGALIIAPTRELALQIEGQCKMLAHNSGLTGALIIGGMPMGRQVSALKNGANIIIGTPGRLKDHVKQGTLNLSKCHMVVLDEVDRMLDMGFINDVRFLLDLLPAERQSFFFSATLSPEINTLIDGFARDPVTVNVKAGETSDNVHQDVIAYENKTQRLDLLHDILLRSDVKKTLIFCEMKYGAERLAKELVARGFNADALHGGKSQGRRKRAMDSFRDSSINILVATDVAARGIDVVDITHVINFDEPHTYTDYIHRIGRAGRAGRIGHALTFVELKPSIRF